MKFVKILLIEDDPLDSTNIKRNLNKLDIHYKIEETRNGEEALMSLKQNQEENNYPDLILLDINMPRMNGFEFLKNIRSIKNLKHLKCFIISTSDQGIDRETAKNLGISGYIVKPLKLNNPKSIDSFNLMIDLLNFK